MKITNIFEAGEVSAAFAFGRFNPAHQGHIEVWRTVEDAGANWYIGTNPTTVGPNDPLSFEQKKAWMEEIYPPISGHIVPEQSVVTLAARIFKELGNDENASIAYITDATDWAWSGKLLNQYNGKEGAHGYYKFAQIVHVPSPRVSSATALRDAARANDKVAFYHASGTDPKAKVAGKTYFDTVKEACAKYPVPVKRGQKVAEGSESSIQKKIQAKQDSLSLAREQRRAKGQRQQGQREIKLQAEIDRLNTELTQLKRQGVEEGVMSTIANKVMGAAPEQPKYKVGQRVKYETSPHQPDWKDGGRGVGVITAYKNGHYMINGNPVNHFEIKGVVDQGVAEGTDGWIGNPAKWKEAVLQAHGPDIVFKNYSHPGQPGKRSVNAINGAGKQVGVYQRHNKMGMVQPNMQGVAEGSSTTWEVSFDYGPHMSETVKVKAGSEKEAIAKVEKAAEKRGRNIMINWAKPAEQDVAEGSEQKFKVTYDIYGSNKEKPLYTNSRTVRATSEKEAINTLRKLVGGTNYRVEKQGVAEGLSESLVSKIEELGMIGRVEYMGPNYKMPYRATLQDKSTGKVWYQDFNGGKEAEDWLANNLASYEKWKNGQQGVAEMDSQGYTGSRDKKSHSKYGSRDDYELGKGKEYSAKMTTADRMMKDAHDAMMRSMSDADKVKKGWRNPNIKEGAGNIGAQIKAAYKKIYNAGDDAIEFAYNDSPIFAQYWDEYEGDLDSIIAEVDPQELQVILAELQSAAEDQGLAEGAPIVVMPRADRLKKPEPTKVRYQGDIVPDTKPPSTEKRGVKGRPGQRPMPTSEAEGDAKGVPHVTKELLQHIIQQAGTEGAQAIIKSLEWGDGAAKELLQLILKDLQNNVSMAESVKQRLDPSCWKGKHKEGTKIKGGVRVNNCVANEASLSTMRDFFAGDAKANDPLEITKQRLYYDPKAVANKRKEFRSQFEYDQWLKKHNLKSVSGNLKEDEATLSVGDPVEITGDVRFKGATGEVEHVGQGGAFLVVNLYNFGKRSFHSSDVSYNDYVDSDEEEARAYDTDPDARNWQHESVDETANPVLSTEKAKKVSPILGSKPKKHPFNGRLVGEDLDRLKARMDEVSNSLLGRYKKAAGADASKADKEGDFEKGNKRFKGIVKATNKEFDNDMKKNKGTEK